MKNHKDLDVWKKSIDLVAQIYEISKNFPKEEMFGLQSQVRRAAVSIPSNISEGASRNSKKEFIQFLYIALGSASEIETQIIVAQKIGYLKDMEKMLLNIEDIKKMLNGLISFLRKNNVPLSRLLPFESQKWLFRITNYESPAGTYFHYDFNQLNKSLKSSSESIPSLDVFSGTKLAENIVMVDKLYPPKSVDNLCCYESRVNKMGVSNYESRITNYGDKLCQN